MKNLILKTLGFTFISTIVFAQEGGGTKTIVADSTQQQQESVFSISVESAFTNFYLWRGIEFNNGLILQPSVNLEYKGFILNLWNSTSILETNNNSIAQEIDFTLSKIIEPGNFYFEPALLLYTYPSKNSFNATAEASVFAAYYKGDFGLFINPSVDILSNSGGAFSETGFTYDHESEKIHIVTNFAYGLGNRKFVNYNILGDESQSINSNYRLIDINGYVQKSLNETLYIKPSFNFFHLIGTAFTNTLNTNQLNIAISIGAEF